MKKHILYTIALIGLVSLFSACSNDDEPSLVDGDYGYLSLDLAVAKSNQVTMTKAGEVDVNDFLVTIKKDSDPDFNFPSHSFQQLKEKGTLRLEAGTYTVSASQAGEMKNDQPFYAGETSITVNAKFFTQCSINCVMQQVRVKVALSDKLKAVLSKDHPVSIALLNPDNSINHAFVKVGQTEEYAEVYVKPTEGLRLSFSATENEYLEPIIYNELLLKAGGVTPQANDFLTVTLGVKELETKSVSIHPKDAVLNIKVTVE